MIGTSEYLHSSGLLKRERRVRYATILNSFVTLTKLMRSSCVASFPLQYVADEKKRQFQRSQPRRSGVTGNSRFAFDSGVHVRAIALPHFADRVLQRRDQ